MSSLKSKDRVSLCSFSFADGRRCRTPRAAKNRHFCFYHAQKEARSRAADTLGKDLDYFFSGNYLSACDLSTALGRLIPAVLRGDVKPRAARTVAYLAQTLLQAIHLSKHEYINAFGTDGWRRSISNSVKGNYDYRFPPDPEPQQPASPQPQPQQPVEPPANCHSGAVAQAFRPEEPASSSNLSLATHHSPLPQTPQPAPSPRTPLPATGAEFADQVLARLPRAAFTPALSSGRSDLVGLTGGSPAPQPSSAPAAKPPQPASTTLQPAETSVNCHSERREESASSSDSPLATHHSPLAPVPPTTAPPTPQRGPNRDAPWLNWGDHSHIRPDSHLL